MDIERVGENKKSKIQKDVNFKISMFIQIKLPKVST